LNLPLGYRYSAVYAGIRKDPKDDLALIASDHPASAAAVFTQNLIQAAPVKLARKHLKKSKGAAAAILVNAGNANCATRTGDAVASTTSSALAKLLDCSPDQVLPASTGVIGVELDPNLIANALPALVEHRSADRFEDVARAILTTDTCMKTASHEIELKDARIRIAGMAKGSGMIHPNLATTLAFVMTDAAISPKQLRAMLSSAADRSFNRLSVDGDTSTNDALILLANGASGVKPNHQERKVVEEVLCWVLEELAEQIARDGEGARKLITIRVKGAADEDGAVRIARSIANSPLVKTAIAGSDPNWGRILSAAGNAGVRFDPRKVEIYLQGILVCESGVAAEFSEAELKAKLNAHECLIRFVIKGKGHGHARFWTCDMTENYIKINASYRT
jgi:glutamate N-acetyltransferase/amino-acid N-acetyltransferase